MSRTDKDRPYEVRARDPYEHTYEHHNHVPTWRYNSNEPNECDLEEWVRDGNNSHIYDENGRRIWRHCYRSLEYTRNYGYHVPKWYVDHTWNNPQRVIVRDVLNRARQWYNGGDDLEDFDFPNEQHHHRSAYYWD